MKITSRKGIRERGRRQDEELGIEPARIAPGHRLAEQHRRL